MGRNLGLLDSLVEADDEDILRSQVFTAWCLFTWQRYDNSLLESIALN
jgi:hypothetical protein